MTDGLAAWATRGAALAVGVLLVVGLAALVLAAGNVLVLIFVAVIVGAGLAPVVGWLRGRLSIARGGAILLTYGAFLAIVVAMALLVVPAALNQFETTLEALPPFFDEARRWAQDLRPAGLSRSLTALIDAAARAVRPVELEPSSGEVIEVGVTVAEVLMSVLTLLTVVYFWLTERARLQRYALAFVPEARRARTRDAWNLAETRLGLWVRGQLILMGSIGILTTIAYTVLGVPAAILLGLIAALAEAIPIVGPLLGAIPAIVVAATVSPELAVVVAGVYFVLQVVEGNVLVPLVMRHTVGISPFLVILSVLVGAAAGGFVGALLAVPIAATAEVLVGGFQHREVPVAQDPLGGGDPSDEPTPDQTNAPESVDDDPKADPPGRRRGRRRGERRGATAGAGR